MGFGTLRGICADIRESAFAGKISRSTVAAEAWYVTIIHRVAAFGSQLEPLQPVQ
jgi:hypothetical protein